jgi:hypothetical protein
MAVIPWSDPIKSTGKLTIFPTSDVTTGSWGPIFQQALQEFNRLSNSNKLGVEIVEAKTPPDPNSEAGTNAQFDVGSGTVSGKQFGREFSEPFSSSETHGFTKCFFMQYGSNPLVIVRGLVFVPKAPTVHGPGNDKYPYGPLRLIGDPLKVFIAVHEFIHLVSGMNNNDHSPDNDPDVFLGPPPASPTLDPGKKPADDKFRVGSYPNYKRFPPLTLTARTVQLIQKAWK